MNASSLHQIGNSPIVSLGDYITECDERNDKGNYGIDDVRGISIQKKLIDTKADMTGVSLSPYKVLKPREFCYVTVTSRNGGKISLAINDEQKTFIVSSSYITFKSKDNNVLLPEYLFLLLNRPEFDRYSRFNSWGSARETFDWCELCRTKVPLPSIETQREFVTVYNGFKSLAEENEALLQPLSDACQAFIVDCKEKYPLVNLGDYIEEYDEKNVGNVIKEVRSVSVYKDFRFTNAKVNKDELSGYKIVPPFHIAYVQTTKNEKCFAHALNSTYQTYVVSAVDRVIKSKDNDILDISFLSLFLRRKEFDRFAIFNSWGSAREVFSFEDLCAVQIPLPPKDVQQSIVNLYRCYEEAKQIAVKAREQLKTICPALIQKAAHSA